MRGVSGGRSPERRGNGPRHAGETVILRPLLSKLRMYDDGACWQLRSR